MTLSSSVTESRVRFWQAHVRALAASGLSRRGYCRRHQLSYHALTYWVRKFRQVPAHASPPALVEVRGGRGKLDKLLSGKSATRNALRWA